MKILERYILSEFVRLFVLAMLAFVLLFLMVDVFENMNAIMKRGVPAAKVAIFFLYKVPFILSQTAPIAVLVSTLISLGQFKRNNEITAMKAGGVRLGRVLLPLLVAGAVISIGVLVMNEYVTPSAMRAADNLKAGWSGAQGRNLSSTGMWLRTPEGILNIRQFDMKKNEVHGITLYEMERPFTVKGRINARSAAWQGDAWVADKAEQWSFPVKGRAVVKEASNLPINGIFPPESLAGAENMHKNMSFFELKRYVERLVADGYNATRYKMELYAKASFPLVNFIMALIGISFALLRTGRTSGIAVGIAMSMVIAFGYWVVFAMSKSLGVAGVVPPLVAALFTNVLFLAVGALLFGYVRE